ncbi:MAG TPA: hypothetical protein VM425_00640 [Myxococcota bacterium]|nr:hypothetical protein [Myxococcota bacterium]
MNAIQTGVCLLAACFFSFGGCDQSSDHPTDGGPSYDPWTVVPSSELPAPRSWSLRRGIIHSHSPYSHDACDDEPFTNGVRNEQCFEECRAGMCGTYQDFVFLTDHDNLFADYEYPEVLLYKQGDSLIERDGGPVANRVDCGNGHQVIVAAGTETAMMPIGIEHHLGDTSQERKQAYGEVSLQAVRALQQAGALVFLQHTEGWEIETILDLPIDGIECYNLHQNLMDNWSAALELLLGMDSAPENLPVMELGIIGIFQESEADMLRWSKALMHKPLPAVLATDAHRNVFDGASPDGERLDSFRRMMHWFSNYVLVPAGELDDRVLKKAISDGRLYGCFDFLGYARGFDFYAQGDDIYEMGEQIPAGKTIDLHLVLPEVYKLDPDGPAPIIRGRILKAEDGDWQEVAAGTDDLVYRAGPGAYRAEVRIVPEHLRPWLGPHADDYIKEFPWIYSNPIYVSMSY